MKPLHELNALCAEKVAGWKHTKRKSMVGGEIFFDEWREASGVVSRPPPYTTDPAAVLGLLEKDHYDVDIHFSQTSDLWTVRLLQRFTGKDSFCGQGDTFALAATLALLKAHGCEVGE